MRERTREQVGFWVDSGKERESEPMWRRAADWERERERENFIRHGNTMDSYIIACYYIGLHGKYEQKSYNTTFTWATGCQKGHNTHRAGHLKKQNKLTQEMQWVCIKISTYQSDQVRDLFVINRCGLSTLICDTVHTILQSWDGYRAPERHGRGMFVVVLCAECTVAVYADVARACAPCRDSRRRRLQRMRGYCLWRRRSVPAATRDRVPAAAAVRRRCTGDILSALALLAAARRPTTWKTKLGRPR